MQSERIDKVKSEIVNRLCINFPNQEKEQTKNLRATTKHDRQKMTSVVKSVCMKKTSTKQTA